MGTLTTAAFAAALAVTSVPAPAMPADRWKREIAVASRRFGIPQEWIRQVIEVESGGRTSLAGVPIVSAAGAMGLMQLMPGTWTEMRDAHRLGPDPFDPRDNVLAGTAYLRAMYDRFGYPGLFAAYNAGPARYLRFLAGDRLPSETLSYLRRVTRPGGAPTIATRVSGRARQGRAIEPAAMFALDGKVAQKPAPVLIAPAADMLLAIVH